MKELPIPIADCRLGQLEAYVRTGQSNSDNRLLSTDYCLSLFAVCCS